LQVDDGLAQLKVLEAEADVLAGEQQLAEARTLPELYKLQNEQQEAAVKAVALDIDKTKADRDSKLLSVSDSPQLSKKLTEYYQFALDQLAQKKIAEEAKLKQVKLQNAELKIKQAEADLTAKKVRVKEAKVAVSYYKIVAPSDGYVLRVLSREGETLGSNPRTPALEFVTDAPIVVRAEVLQEWGRYVKPGAEVVIEDDTYKGPTWDGVVKSVSSWYATTRSPIIEPFRYNDVRTLECIIEVTKGDTPKFIGQRVRAKIKIEK
jgi:membrane fusion protein (multidrug efflux system)